MYPVPAFIHNTFCLRIFTTPIVLSNRYLLCFIVSRIPLHLLFIWASYSLLLRFGVVCVWHILAARLHDPLLCVVVYYLYRLKAPSWANHGG